MCGERVCIKVYKKIYGGGVVGRGRGGPTRRRGVLE